MAFSLLDWILVFLIALCLGAPVAVVSQLMGF